MIFLQNKYILEKKIIFFAHENYKAIRSVNTITNMLALPSILVDL